MTPVRAFFLRNVAFHVPSAAWANTAEMWNSVPMVNGASLPWTSPPICLMQTASLLMAVPLVLLYELSIWGVYFKEVCSGEHGARKKSAKQEGESDKETT